MTGSPVLALNVHWGLGILSNKLMSAPARVDLDFNALHFSIGVQSGLAI
jgi:hypothetical protein